MCQHRPTITPWLLSAILVSCLLTNTTARADEQTAPPPEPASTAPDSQTGAPLYDQLYRPQFHFTAARNWLNDPNGLVFYKG